MKIAPDIIATRHGNALMTSACGFATSDCGDCGRASIRLKLNRLYIMYRTGWKLSFRYGADSHPLEVFSPAIAAEAIPTPRKSRLSIMNPLTWNGICTALADRIINSHCHPASAASQLTGGDS